MVTNLAGDNNYFQRMRSSLSDKFALIDELPDSGVVLDVGCGDGALMRRLSSSGFEVRGVDASPESVRRSGVGAVLGYADEVDHLFPPRSFDAVIGIVSAEAPAFRHGEEARPQTH